MFVNYEHFVRLPPDAWPHPLPTSGNMISRPDEEILLRDMLEIGMVCLLDLEDVPVS